MSHLHELEQLHALQLAGALTEEEFQREKARVLTGSGNHELRANEVAAAPRNGGTWLIILASIIVTIVIVATLKLVSAPNREATGREPSMATAQPYAEPTTLRPTPSETDTQQPPKGPVDDWHTASKSEANADDFRVPDMDFTDYPANLLAGTFRKPKKDFGFTTRFAEAERAGVNFAGHYAFVQIGCGTECSTAYAIDGKTGAAIEFPLGGEEYRQLQLSFSPVSKLVKAYWLPTRDSEDCSVALFVIAKSEFKQIPNKSGDSGCPDV